MTAPISTLLVLPKLQIQNANALSSAISVGFPAVTGFMGAVHAMERKVRDKGFNVRFTGVGIISHSAQLHTLQNQGSYQRSLISKALPLNKDGTVKSFIPSARIHLTVSLVIDVEGDADFESLLAYLSSVCLQTMRVAGGDLIGFETPYFAVNADQSMERKSLNKLMPGYALIDRSDLMREAMADGSDAIDSLLDNLAIHNYCEQQHDSRQSATRWRREKRHAGWIVPVGVGFQGLTPLGKAKHVRDEQTEHRFAESVVSLGEFKMLHQVKGLRELLWRYDTTSFKDLYLCVSDSALSK